MVLNNKLLKKDLLKATENAILSEPGGQLSIVFKKQFDPVVEVFCDAFRKDPFLLWVASEAKDDKEELERLRTWLFSWLTRPILFRGKGVVLAAKDRDDRIVGAASLLASDRTTESFLDTLTNAFALGGPPCAKSGAKKKFGPMSEKRLMHSKVLTERRVEIMSKKKCPRYIYLQAIGVATEHQGRGLGGKLLRKIFQIAESLGDTAIYLETESEENESLYQHLGFETAERLDMSVPGDTSEDAVQRMWLMVRPP